MKQVSLTDILNHQSTHECFARGMAHSPRVEVVFYTALADLIVAGNNFLAEHLQPFIKRLIKDCNSLN